MRLCHALRLGAFLFALVVLIGCGDNNLAVVKGSVKFDGKPIENGSIAFYPVDGKSATAGVEIKDGQYSVQVPVGLMKVQIGGVRKVVGMKEASEGPGGKARPITAEAIPAIYSDRAKTVLDFDVKPGVNQKDWDLKTP
jgi:hypothetical protein